MDRQSVRDHPSSTFQSHSLLFEAETETKGVLLS